MDAFLLSNPFHTMYFSNRENPENLFKLVDIGQLLKNQFERKKLLLKRPNQVHLSKPVPKTEDMRSLLRESFANLNQIVNAKPKEHILASVVKMDDNQIFRELFDKSADDKFSRKDEHHKKS